MPQRPMISWPLPIALGTTIASLALLASSAETVAPAISTPPLAAAATNVPAGTAMLFFGYVEFDADPNAPGGVPGFGPWPSSPPVATVR